MRTKYDDLMIESLRKLKDLEFSHIYEDEDLNYEFSKEYIKHKEMLIKSVGRPYWKFINTVAKKVAIIIVTLIIVFSSLMTVDAFREKVVSFFYKIYSTYIQIESKPINTTNKIIIYYSLKEVPAHFNMPTANFNEYISIQYWRNRINENIVLTQNLSREYHQFNSEHGELSERIINDTPCLICKDSNLYYCYWEFDGYRFELIYPLDLGEEFMSEVVGNLVEIDLDELGN